jgi:hypothetical protein
MTYLPFLTEVDHLIEVGARRADFAKTAKELTGTPGDVELIFGFLPLSIIDDLPAIGTTMQGSGNEAW